MQANKINVGSEYAVNVQGKYNEETVAVLVTEISTVKASDGVKSYITGWTGAGEDRRQLKNIPVKDVIDTVGNHDRLAAEKTKAETERKAKQTAREEKQWMVCQLLAKAIDAKAVKSKYSDSVYGGKKPDWDWDMALVFCDGSSVEINEHAFDKLTGFLVDAMPTPDDPEEVPHAEDEKAWEEENYTKR